MNNLSRYSKGLQKTLALILVFGMTTGNTYARIAFEDAPVMDINSSSIILDANNNNNVGDDIGFQFGNDGTDASMIYNPSLQDITFNTPSGVFDFSSGDLQTGTVASDSYANLANIPHDVESVVLATPCVSGDVMYADDTETFYFCNAVGGWVSAATSATLSADGLSTSHNAILASNAVTLGDITSGIIATNAGGGDAHIQIKADENIDITSTTFSPIRISQGPTPATRFEITSGGALNLDPALDANLTMTTTGFGRVVIDTPTWDITSGGDATGFNTLAASGNITTGTGNLVATTGDLVIGTVGLDDTTADAEGATLIGTGGFTNITGSTVQAVLEDIDAEFGAIDFEDIYANDTGNNLVTTDSDFTIDTGLGDIILDSQLWGIDLDGNATLDTLKLRATTPDVIVLDSDNTTGAGQTVQIIAKQGTEANGRIQYEATNNQWEIDHGSGTFYPIVTGDGTRATFDTVYDTSDTDGDRTMDIDSGEVNFDITNPGGVAFNIQSDGTTVASFGAIGSIDFTPKANQNLTATASGTGDIDLQTGTGDFTLSVNGGTSDILAISSTSGFTVNSGNAPVSLTSALSTATLQGSGANIISSGTLSSDLQVDIGSTNSGTGDGDIFIHADNDGTFHFGENGVTHGSVSFSNDNGATNFFEIDSSDNITLQAAGTMELSSTNWSIATDGTTNGLGFGNLNVNQFGNLAALYTSGATNPGTCTLGDRFYNTTDGELYECGSSNDWSVVTTVSTLYADGVSSSTDYTITAPGYVALKSNSGGNIDLNTSGTINIGGAGGVNFTGGGSGGFDFSSGGPFDVSYGGTGVLFTGPSAFTVSNGGGIDLTAVGSTMEVTSGGDINLTTSPSGDINLSAGVGLSMSSPTWGIDGSGTAGLTDNLSLDRDTKATHFGNVINQLPEFTTGTLPDPCTLGNIVFTTDTEEVYECTTASPAVWTLVPQVQTTNINSDGILSDNTLTVGVQANAANDSNLFLISTNNGAGDANLALAAQQAIDIGSWNNGPITISQGFVTSENRLQVTAPGDVAITPATDADFTVDVTGTGGAAITTPTWSIAADGTATGLNLGTVPDLTTDGYVTTLSNYTDGAGAPVDPCLTENQFYYDTTGNNWYQCISSSWSLKTYGDFTGEYGANGIRSTGHFTIETTQDDININSTGGLFLDATGAKGISIDATGSSGDISLTNSGHSLILGSTVDLSSSSNMTLGASGAISMGAGGSTLGVNPLGVTVGGTIGNTGHTNWSIASDGTATGLSFGTVEAGFYGNLANYATDTAANILASSCVVGDAPMYAFNTLTLYYCTAPNTWTAQDPSGNLLADGFLATHDAFFGSNATSSSEINAGIKAVNGGAGTANILLEADDNVDIISTGGTMELSSGNWSIDTDGLANLSAVTPTSFGNVVNHTTGTATPGTCTVDDTFYDTDDDILYYCTATNVWTAQPAQTSTMYRDGIESDDTFALVVSANTTEDVAAGIIAINDGAGQADAIVTAVNDVLINPIFGEFALKQGFDTLAEDRIRMDTAGSIWVTPEDSQLFDVASSGGINLTTTSSADIVVDSTDWAVDNTGFVTADAYAAEGYFGFAGLTSQTTASILAIIPCTPGDRRYSTDENTIYECNGTGTTWNDVGFPAILQYDGIDTSTTEFSMFVNSNIADAFAIRDGGTEYLSVDSRTGSVGGKKVEFGVPIYTQNINSNSGLNISAQFGTDLTLTSNDIIFNPSGIFDANVTGNVSIDSGGTIALSTDSGATTITMGSNDIDVLSDYWGTSLGDMFVQDLVPETYNNFAGLTDVAGSFPGTCTNGDRVFDSTTNRAYFCSSNVWFESDTTVIYGDGIDALGLEYTVQIDPNLSDAFRISDGTTEFMNVNSTNGAEKITFGVTGNFSNDLQIGGTSLQGTAGANLIGANDTAFTNISGSNVQSLFASVDTALGGVGTTWLDIGGGVRNSAALGTVASGNAPAILFDEASDSSVAYSLPVPSAWAGGNITVTVYFSNATGSPSNSVDLNLDYSSRAFAETIGAFSAATGNSTSANISSTADNIRTKVFTIPAAALAANDVLMVKLYRLPSTGADAFTGDVSIHMIRVEY